MLHNHHAVYPPIPITDIPGDDDVIILTMWSPSRSHWVPASINLLLLHLYSLTWSELIKSTEHNWWKFSRAMRYIITDISSCYHHPHSPAIRASSLLQLLSCQSPVAHHISPGWAFKDGRLEEISNMENALMQQPRIFYGRSTAVSIYYPIYDKYLSISIK